LTRFTVVFLLTVLACLCCGGQVNAAPAAAESHAAEKHGGGHEGPSIWWKWANFGMLAAGLGFLIGRHTPGFFQSRTEEIRKAIADAARMKQEADARAAEIAERMKNLENEIAALRRNATEEMSVEAERIRRESEQQAAKIQKLSGQEIASAVKSARSELKAYSAELALELAEKKIRAQLDEPADSRLFSGFLKGLK
jgi:F-type H+-transporting ATPase subunit b